MNDTPTKKSRKGVVLTVVALVATIVLLPAGLVMGFMSNGSNALLMIGSAGAVVLSYFAFIFAFTVGLEGDDKRPRNGFGFWTPSLQMLSLAILGLGIVLVGSARIEGQGWFLAVGLVCVAAGYGAGALAVVYEERRPKQSSIPAVAATAPDSIGASTRHVIMKQVGLAAVALIALTALAATDGRRSRS